MLKFHEILLDQSSVNFPIEAMAIVQQDIAVVQDGGSNELAATAVGVSAEFSLAWPPTFPVGGPAEVVELRTALALDAAAATATAAAEAQDAGGGGVGAAAVSDFALLSSAAAGCCSRVLAVRDDMVVGDEKVRMLPGGGSGGRAR